ncbi:MAG: DUF2461 domain-containing protein [Calditrichaeota bacterium]|nr:MAG: DUF2461 domain-containing protein [Calditrichota bacterium]
MNFNIILDFLSDLRVNNNREWFKENNERYQKAKSQFERFVENLLPEIKQFDNTIDILSPKEFMFRIFRDVRFSKNKAPYKTNFGAFIAPGGRRSPYAGYYVHMEPGHSFLGGGIYQPDPKILFAVRTRIFNNPDRFKEIIQNKDFKKYFPEIYGEKLKTAPRGFPRDFTDIDLLKHKHYAIACKVDDTFWLEGRILDKVVDVFKNQYAFNHYLNQTIINVTGA